MLNERERIFFEVVGPRLERFANEYNMKLERWFKEVALWTLNFRHPRGGAAHVVVGPGQDDGAALHAAWWVDEYETETRRIASGPRHNAGLQAPILESALLDEIRRVLDWTEADFDKEAKMPPGIWHRWFSKREFAKLTRSLPLPRL